MYKILNDLTAELGDVTVKAVKVIKSHGFLDKQGVTDEEVGILINALEDSIIDKLARSRAQECMSIVRRAGETKELDVYVDDSKVYEIADAIFVLSDEQRKQLKENIENVRLDEVIRALYFFLGKLNPPSLNVQELTKTLQSLRKQTT